MTTHVTQQSQALALKDETAKNSLLKLQSRPSKHHRGQVAESCLWTRGLPTSEQLSWSEGFSAHSVPVPVQPDRSGVVSGLGAGVLAPVWGDSC